MTTFAASPIELHLVRENRVGGALHRDRRLQRVHHGVYASRAEWEALLPWDRYLARVHAVRLARPGSVFCLESAAVLSELPIFGEPRQVHVLGKWSPGVHTHSSGGVVVHRLQARREVTTSGNTAAVSIADTMLDLARLLPPGYGLAVADAALRIARADVTIEALRDYALGRGWARGSKRLEWVLDHANPLSESAGESLSRAAIEWLGYAAPELQRWFRFEGADDRCDFHWTDADVVGESDGYGKYDAADAAAAKKKFVDEKVREDRLRRHVRGFARWDWGDTTHPRRLDAKLRAAGLRPVSEPNPRMLATLATNPRSFGPNLTR